MTAGNVVVRREAYSDLAALALIVSNPPVILGVRENVADVNALTGVINLSDQPVLIPLDIEHGPLTNGVNARESPSNV
jgi:hypothetical protein